MTFVQQIPPVFQSVILLLLGALVVLSFVPYFNNRISAMVGVGIATAVLSIVPVASAQSDSLLPFISVLIVAVGLVYAVWSVSNIEIDEESHRLEMTALSMLAAIGTIVLVNGTDLLQMALGLETLSVSGAVMVSLGRGLRPLEGGFKYFVLGAVSFAILLYGMALIYVGTGSIAFPNLASVGYTQSWFVLGGSALIAVGLAFKMALVPFHAGPMDLYTSAPPGVAGYLMMSSKLGAGIAMARLLMVGDENLNKVVMILSVISIFMGAFGGMPQRDWRRMFAYSAVGHAGFLGLTAIQAAQTNNFQAVTFYVLSYAASVLLAFVCLAGMGTQELGEQEAVKQGMGPWRALGLIAALLSLAGIPPFPGFWAKLDALSASASVFGLWPTLFAALGGVYGVLYYLRPLPELGAQLRIKGPRFAMMPLAVLGLVVVGLLSVMPAMGWNWGQGDSVQRFRLDAKNVPAGKATKLPNVDLPKP